MRRQISTLSPMDERLTRTQDLLLDQRRLHISPHVRQAVTTHPVPPPLRRAHPRSDVAKTSSAHSRSHYHHLVMGHLLRVHRVGPLRAHLRTVGLESKGSALWVRLARYHRFRRHLHLPRNPEHGSRHCRPRDSDVDLADVEQWRGGEEVPDSPDWSLRFGRSVSPHAHTCVYLCSLFSWPSFFLFLTTANSATLCSITRFIIIVDNRATTYPAFDPTWYGGTAIALSVLEVNIATIVAALPVFWPLLRRNIDRIFITHEVEVKVTSTEGFSQIEGDGDVKRQTHWPDDSTKPSANNNAFEVVVLKDLKNTTTTTTTTTSDNSSRSRPSITVEDTFDVGMPFDGRRSNSRAHARLNSSHSVSSQSKEILLRRPT